MTPRRRSPVQMGTVLSKALSLVGITQERVSAIFGACGCRRRATKLNELSDWAWGLLRRSADTTDVTEEEKKAAEESFKRIEGAP